MREVPYETDHDVRARSRRDYMHERINDFLARGGRGRGRSSRSPMNRIGYRTYDTYEDERYNEDGRRYEHDGYDRRYREHRGYDDDERQLLMGMLGVGYDDDEDEHFNKQEAKQIVDGMYHVKDGKKYVGEKYDMRKAEEVCEKYKHKLEGDVDVADMLQSTHSSTTTMNSSKSGSAKETLRT